MIFKYIGYLYNKFKCYLYSNNLEETYNIPFPLKHKSYDINKVIFAINNMPHIIHNILFFDMKTVSQNYYYIRLDNSCLSHNLENLDKDMHNSEIEFIFIRLDLINKNKYINHVNGIYINKNKKYILIFEPKFELSFDKNTVEELIQYEDYKFIYAEDIGYTKYTKMQNYDLFCQTYVLLTFFIITHNDNNYNDYTQIKSMISSIINSKSIDCFHYYLYELLKKNNYEICEQNDLFSYNVVDIVKFLFKKNEIINSENLREIDEDGLCIVTYSKNDMDKELTELV